MNYSVRTIQPFDKQFKRFLKKYPSLKLELAALVSQLEQTPDTGTPIGHDCYKTRMAVASKGKGKSGGQIGTINYHRQGAAETPGIHRINSPCRFSRPA